MTLRILPCEPCAHLGYCPTCLREQARGWNYQEIFRCKSYIGVQSLRWKETPPLSLLRANSLTLEAKYTRGCLAPHSPDAAGSWLLLGSPQLAVRSFSALEVIEIVTATVHESASDVHGSPPPKASDYRKGSKRTAASRSPNQRQFYWFHRRGSVGTGGGGRRGSRLHRLRPSGRGRSRVGARRCRGCDGERGGRRRGECSPWSPLHFAYC
jgi:hypothetical protein